MGDGADSDDADGIVDEADNCPVTPNPQQEDLMVMALVTF